MLNEIGRGKTSEAREEGKKIAKERASGSASESVDDSNSDNESDSQSEIESEGGNEPRWTPSVALDAESHAGEESRAGHREPRW